MARQIIQGAVVATAFTVFGVVCAMVLLTFSLMGWFIINMLVMLAGG